MSEAAGGTLVGGGNKRNGGDVKEGQKDITLQESWKSERTRVRC